MPLRRVRTPVEQLQPFERETGWTYQRIAAHVGHNVSMACRFFQQWSVKHTPVDQVLDGRLVHSLQDRRIVRAVVAARTTPREEIRTHIVAYPVCNQGSL